MSKKVLVVDNCPVTVRLLSHMLEKEHFAVKTAMDGLTALQVMEQFRPDIMIIDIIMPNIPGDKLCKIIRSKPEFKDIFIVFLSAIAAEEEIDFIALGADACIAKGPAKEMVRNIIAVFELADNKKFVELKKRVFGLEDVHARQIIKELMSYKHDFETTLHNMADGFVALTPTAKIIAINSAAVNFFNKPEERLISSSFFDHFEKEQQLMIIDRFQRITSAAIEIGEKEPIILNGRYLLIKIVPVSEETIKSLIVLIDDITQRKVAELELLRHRMCLEELVAQRAAELEEVNEELKTEIEERRKIQNELADTSRHLSKTLNTVTDFISVHDRDMKIVRANKALADFIKVSPEHLIGRHCYEIMHGSKTPWPNCPHVEAMKCGLTITYEVNDPHIGKPLLVTCSPFIDDNGQMCGTVHVARDISAQKLAEQEREKLIAELQAALSKVKQLSGFLPICSSCKKIRDDKGYWNQIESYIRDHSEAEFSHGICPECAKQLYPELLDKDGNFITRKGN